MSSGDAITEDSYFNDLSRQPSLPQNGSDSPPERSATTMNVEEAGAPRQKRVACVICRKRKLKCDGSKPKCATCARLGHSCAYNEVRRKSGPKRGYVKELEARLAQVETQLKTKAPKAPDSAEPTPQPTAPEQSAAAPLVFERSNSNGIDINSQETMDGIFNSTSNTQDISPVPSTMMDVNLGLDDPMSWEMIGLGLEEPLPTQEAIDELHKLFFQKVHPSMPMIHQYRYLAAMNLAPHMRPAVCLRYAMWCLAAGASDKYFNHQDIFYRRARKYADLDDMKGQGEASADINHAQCWALISTYEFKMMCFPRAWTSVGKSVRLAQMLGLHRMDGAGVDFKQCLPPPRDWTDREQRRRTWWMAYCMDRYASVGTGWPMAIDEKDIMTNLPATEEAYDKGIPQETPSLDNVMRSEGAASLSPFAGVVLMAHFFGCNLIHLQRPEPDERDHDLQGAFWKRHRSMDNTLLNTSLNLPLHLRLPAGVRDPNTVFLNMNIHTSTICLHQAAIFKAEKNNMPNNVIEQSSTRCLLAASEITSVMRLISHLDVSGMNPFMAFCLYIAARVFLHFLKRSPDDHEIGASLRFLLSAMSAMKRTQPVTESFLIQLNLDMVGSGLGALLQNPELSSSFLNDMPNHKIFNEAKCSPLFDIRETPNTRIADQMDSFTRKNDMYDLFQPFNGEAPRATQYSLQDFSIPTREQRQPRKTLHEGTAAFPSYSSSNRSQGWAHGQQERSYETVNSIELEMSDHASGGRHSTGLTPFNSHPPSSTTSHSSPSDGDPNSAYEKWASNPKGSPPNMPYLGYPRPNANQFTPPSESEITAPPVEAPGDQQHDDGSFTTTAGWRLESTGDTPNPTAGMTPLGESGWAQVLGGMGWDGDALLADGLAWPPTTESMT